MNRKVFLAIALIAITALACSFSASTNPTQPANSGPVSNNLYQDDFSNSSSGWLTESGDIGSMAYADGRFRIIVSETYSDIISNANVRLPADVAIEVDATKNSGTEDNDYGLICRLQDLNNFYFFQVSSDGYAVIGMFKDNEMDYLSSDGMTKVDGILGGGSTNRLRAVCQGSSLSLYANGKLLVQVTDSTFTSGGDVGLMAGTFSEGGVDILFDNFVVTAP